MELPDSMTFATNTIRVLGQCSCCGSTIFCNTVRTMHRLDWCKNNTENTKKHPHAKDAWAKNVFPGKCSRCRLGMNKKQRKMSPTRASQTAHPSSNKNHDVQTQLGIPDENPHIHQCTRDSKPGWHEWKTLMEINLHFQSAEMRDLTVRLNLQTNKVKSPQLTHPQNLTATHGLLNLRSNDTTFRVCWAYPKHQTHWEPHKPRRRQQLHTTLQHASKYSPNWHHRLRLWSS